MRILHGSARAETIVPSDLFDGQTRFDQLVTLGEASMSLVSFSDGARTRWHVHTFSQALFISNGSGIVATEEEEVRVSVGDVVIFEPGERHWHGAVEGVDMTHVSVNGRGETTW